MLLLLRRGHRTTGGAISFEPLDLRHQRTPDSILGRWSNHQRRIVVDGVP